MATRKSHKDVEYQIDKPSGGTATFKTFDEAASMAVSIAAGGSPCNLDVLVYSKSGARFVSGAEGVEQYEEDPDASVFERLVISVDIQGRIA
jgi:hypothetical protein